MRVREARAGSLVAVAVTSFTLVACARATGTTATVDGRDGEPPATASPSVGAPADAWIAILGSAKDPGLLDPDRKRVLAALGDVLEGSVVVSPGGCLEGLPGEFSDGYVLAIQRESRDDVRALSAQLPQEPSFIGSVTVVCTD